MIPRFFLSTVLLCFIGTAWSRQPFVVRRTTRFLATSGQSKSNPELQGAAYDETIDRILLIRGGDFPSAQETLLAQGSVVHSFLQTIDVMGTAVFAFSGAVKAGKKGMDILGMTIIACITAIGGGTVRDLLLGTGGRAIFWLRNPLYIEICVATTVATFFLWPKLEKEFGFKDSALLICTADAFGLAAFCVLGTQRGVRKNLRPTMWVVSGVITSVFGGIIRDVICGEPPRAMYPYRTMYGAGPALGSTVYTLLSQFPNIETDLVASIAFVTVFAVRVLSFNNSSRLPHWRQEKKRG